jgi:hypothetical protein
MKRIGIFIVALLCAGVLIGDDKKTAGSAGAGAAKPSQEEMMAIMMKMATPNENHKKLESMTGEWKADVTCWMSPGTPEKSQGTTKNQMIMGGRFIKCEFEGSMMGRPFKGVHILGYDNAKKKFVGTWFDDMSTGIMTSEGTGDESGKTITMRSECLCPITNEMMPMRMVTTMPEAGSGNTMKFEMFGPAPDGSGKEIKTMEIAYTRVK